MRLYLENDLSIDKLQSELNDVESEFYFAILNNKITAYLKIKFRTNQEKFSIEIERIYVLQAFQGMKIGQVLLNKVIQIAGQRPVDFI